MELKTIAREHLSKLASGIQNDVPIPRRVKLSHIRQLKPLQKVGHETWTIRNGTIHSILVQICDGNDLRYMDTIHEKEHLHMSFTCMDTYACSYNIACTDVCHRIWEQAGVVSCGTISSIRSGCTITFITVGRQWRLLSFAYNVGFIIPMPPYREAYQYNRWEWCTWKIESIPICRVEAPGYGPLQRGFERSVAKKINKNECHLWIYLVYIGEGINKWVGNR